MKKKVRYDFKRFLVPVGLALAAALLSYSAASFLHTGRSPSLPPLKKHVFTGDFTGYWRDCVANVLESNNVPPACRSVKSIKSSYGGLDVAEVLDIEQGKLIQTAQWIAEGTIQTQTDLDDCIKKEICAPIPVPARNGNGAENEKKRILFWHLVDNGSLTQELCAIMDACKAMSKAGLLYWENKTP